MFCTKCGNKLADNSKFCTVCGEAVAVLRKPEKQKKSKKSLIAVVAVILVIAISAGIILSVVNGGKEIVYVFEGYTRTRADGTVDSVVIEYDAEYNPVNCVDVYNLRPFEMTFDKNNNMTSKVYYSANDTDKMYGFKSEYEYTYKNGKIDSCTEYYDGELCAEWSFTWDKKGNLIQAMVISGDVNANNHNLRYDFEYDDNNRLVAEYIWHGVPNVHIANVSRCEYTYDNKGQIVSYKYARLPVDIVSYQEENYKKLDFSTCEEKLMNVTYTSNGKIESVTIDGNKNTYEYDLNGNLSLWADYSYNDGGKLEFIVSDSGSRTEFEYKAVEMSKEEARRYYRWEQLLNFDYSESMYFPVVSDVVHTDVFFYYLVPNPIW